MTVGISLLAVGMIAVTMMLFASIIVDNMIYLREGHKTASLGDTDWRAFGTTTVCAVAVIIFDSYTTLPEKEFTYQTAMMLCLQLLYIVIGVRIHHRIGERAHSLMERIGKRSSDSCGSHVGGQK